METLFASIKKFKNYNKDAMYFENKVVSYKTLYSNILKMANYLSELGIKEKDVVTLVLPNIPSCIYAFYALNGLGAIQNILHPLTPLHKIKESMKETNSKYLITLGTLYDDIKKEEVTDIKYILANAYYDKGIVYRKLFNLKYKLPNNKNNIYNLDLYNKKKEIASLKDHDPKANSIYLHSGGTTGKSKIIALSDDAFNNLSKKVAAIVEDKDNVKMLAVLPTFHGFGLGVGIHAPLSNGAASTLMIKFDSNKVVKYINQNKLNHIIGIPRLYEKLLENKKFLASKLNLLDMCFVGGDNVPVRLIENYNQTMKDLGSNSRLYEGYGLTETVTVAFVNTKKDTKIASVGKPLPGINVEIRDEELKKLGPNEIGEIFISGDTLMNEYLFDKETTLKTLVNIDNITWVRTGDLGYIDEEGFLFIKGRKKRLIIISGYNVFPNEIEKVSMEIKDITNAVVIYFETPKPHMNLYVIKSKDTSLEDDIIRDKIMCKLRDNFTKYSLPSKIIFMEKFPRTAVGKIDQKAFFDK